MRTCLSLNSLISLHKYFRALSSIALVYSKIINPCLSKPGYTLFKRVFRNQLVSDNFDSVFSCLIL